MSQASNYLENKLLDHTLAVATYTRPTTVYLALYTSNPADDNSGTEVSGSGYSRQAITFGAASGGTSTNTGAVTFTASGGSFGTVSHFSIFDASSGGNMLCYGSLDAARTIASGESLTFPIASVNITVS